MSVQMHCNYKYQGWKQAPLMFLDLWDFFFLILCRIDPRLVD